MLFVVVGVAAVAFVLAIGCAIIIVVVVVVAVIVLLAAVVVAAAASVFFQLFTVRHRCEEPTFWNGGGRQAQHPMHALSSFPRLP